VSIDLSQFQMTASARAIPVRTPTEAELLQPIGNLLLDLAELADDYDRVMTKRARIVARLDDPAIEATSEQRAAAEARASALHYEGQRYLKEFRRKALAWVRAWPELPDELQAFIRDEAFPMRSWDGVAALVDADRDLMGKPCWRQLVSGRDARKEVAA
jgi:hypothetical protein